MLLNQDLGKWVFSIIASISIIPIIGFIITGNVLGIVGIFSNPNLENTLFLSAVVFFLVFITSASVVRLTYGAYMMISDSGDGRKFNPGMSLTKNSTIALIIILIFFSLISLNVRNVPFASHLLLSYFFLLLLLFCSQVYRRLLAIPEEDRYARFIALLEDILPIQFQEEWLGDLQEQHYQLIEEGIPHWKVSFITLLTGLGLIRSYLWLKFHKLVSRWMTRA